MLKTASVLASAAACVILQAGAAAAADRPAPQHVTGPAPGLTAACEFPVTRDLLITQRRLPAPEATSTVEHLVIHVMGSFTGPTGRGFTLTTNVNILARELSDGTVVEATSGRTLTFAGRLVDGALDDVTGRVIDPATYCDDLAP